MLGSEPAKRANDTLELVLAPVTGEDLEKVLGNRIDREFLAHGGERLAGLLAVHQRARNELGELAGIRQRLGKERKAVAHRVDLTLVTSQTEQSGSVASC